MPLYALENIDDALQTTREFLTPVEKRTWLKLALVALFVGGPGTFSFPFTGGSGPSGTGGEPGTGTGDAVELGPDFWFVVAALFAAVVLVILALAIVGAIMEFVFVDSLRTETVRVRRYWSERWGQGLRLFGFRMGLWLLVALVGLVLLVVPFVLALSGIVPLGVGVLLLVLLVMLPLFFLGLLFVGVIQSFTTYLVVPIMIAEDTGVIDAWGRLLPMVKAEWKQYLVFALMGFLLSMGGGIIVGLAGLIGVILVLIPFLLLGLVGGAIYLFASELAGLVVIGVLAILFAVAAVIVFALAGMPVKAYLRYYAMLVLGDLEPDFDLVPEQRAAVRREEESGTDDATGAA